MKIEMIEIARQRDRDMIEIETVIERQRQNCPTGLWELASLKSVGQAGWLEIQVRGNTAVLTLKVRNSGRISMLLSGGATPSENFILCI